MCFARVLASVFLVLGLTSDARAGSSSVLDVSDTTWNMVGRIHYQGATSPDLTNFRIQFLGDGSFTYEIDDGQGGTVTLAGFWVQEKSKVSLVFDEASRGAFEDSMSLNFTNVGFRVDFQIQKWQLECKVKGTEAAPTLDFKYRFKSRYVFNGRESKKRSFGFSFTIKGSGDPA
jgi:hypothetical protein